MELFRTISTLGQGSRFEHFVQIVLKYYAEPHRVYHGVGHIMDGVRLATKLSKETSEFDLSLAQQLAWLCHDIVYIPAAPKGHNEVLSTYMVSSLLRNPIFGSELDPLREVKDKASKIIMSTVEHLPFNEACQAVIDLDLAGFADEEKFFRNNDDIKLEFGVDTQEEFDKGQLAFLSNLMRNRGTLYFTEYALNNWEDSAQKIISDHIVRMESRLDKSL